MIALLARARSLAFVLVLPSLFAAATVGAAAPGTPPPPASLLARHYTLGDTLRFHMDATNQGRHETLTYSADAKGIVRRDSLNRWYEDFAWSNLVRDGHPVELSSPAARAQQLTLSPDYMIPPDVMRTEPRLIGPVLDLFTFYVDLWLAAKLPLHHVGDRVPVPGHGPASWADGRRVVLGEDAVDFQVSLQALDQKAKTATILVRHVPPDSARVTLAAPWMRAPVVAGSPNNWVEVTRADSGRWIAAVGRETFDVTLNVDLRDGRLRSATMENPVDVSERVFSDSALTNGGDAVRYRILRRISLH